MELGVLLLKSTIMIHGFKYRGFTTRCKHVHTPKNETTRLDFAERASTVLEKYSFIVKMTLVCPLKIHVSIKIAVIPKQFMICKTLNSQFNHILFDFKPTIMVYRDVVSIDR